MRDDCNCDSCRTRRELLAELKKGSAMVKTEYKLVSVKCEADVQKMNALFAEGWTPLRMDEVCGVGLYMLSRTAGAEEAVDKLKSSLDKFLGGIGVPR